MMAGGSQYSTYASQMSKLSPSNTKRPKLKLAKPEKKESNLQMLSKFKKSKLAIERDNIQRGYDWTDIFAMRSDQMAFTRDAMAEESKRLEKQRSLAQPKDKALLTLQPTKEPESAQL